MFYFACPCGRQGPRDSGEDLIVLYLIRNPLDPSDTIDVALPWPFCHLVVRVVVIAESKAAKPILRYDRSIHRAIPRGHLILCIFFSYNDKFLKRHSCYLSGSISGQFSDG